MLKRVISKNDPSADSEITLHKLSEIPVYASSKIKIVWPMVSFQDFGTVKIIPPELTIIKNPFSKIFTLETFVVRSAKVMSQPTTPKTFPF